MSARAIVAAAVSGVVLVAMHKPLAAHATGSESPAAAQAIAYAEAQIGKPYVWGGTGPDGFDCSGLTQAAYRSAGIAIPRTSEEQRAQGHRVAHVAVGDLVFSYWAVDNQASPNHVQIYVGHGYVIGADTTDVEQVPLSGDAGHIVGYADPVS